MTLPTELQQLELDLYQATFDIGLTAVHIFVIDDLKDGLIVIDTSAPNRTGMKIPSLRW